MRMGKFAGAVAAMLLAAAVVPCASAAGDAKPEWNLQDNVKDAAKRLGELQRRQGSEAALKFLEACYKTHMLAEAYTEGLESCMAQDYMLSQMLAVIYSRVPDEKLKDMKAPTSDVIAKSMRARFHAIFQQYKLSQEQADNLKKAVDDVGMPIFVQIVFPKRDNADDNGKSAKGDGSEKPPVKIPLPELKPDGPVPSAPSKETPAGEPKQP